MPPKDNLDIIVDLINKRLDSIEAGFNHRMDGVDAAIQELQQRAAQPQASGVDKLLGGSVSWVLPTLRYGWAIVITAYMLGANSSAKKANDTLTKCVSIVDTVKARSK